MKKAEIDALLTAHGGRAHAVASLHVLRQPALDAEDHAFLVGNAEALATIDFHRWLTHATAEQRPAVIDALERFAMKDPPRFEHEVARAKQVGLREEERADLVARLDGRVPASLIGGLRGERLTRPPSMAPRRASSAPPGGLAGGNFFDPGDILREMDLGADSGSPQIGFGPPATGFGPPAIGVAPDGGGLDELLISAEFFADAGGFGGASSPALDALLADRVADGKKARSAWKARALAVALDTTEDWSPSVTRLPKEMRDAALARAECSPRHEERAALLEWLFQNGAPRQKLVDLTLSSLEDDEKADGVREWLAHTWIPKLLSDKASWSKHGAAVLGAMIDARAFSELDELFTVTVSGAGAPGSPAPPPEAALRGPIFSAFSAALLDLTGSALGDGRRKEALAFASALASAGVPSRSVAGARALRRKRAAKGEVSTLLALTESRARGPKESPRVEDFIAAVHVLSDALS